MTISCAIFEAACNVLASFFSSLKVIMATVNPMDRMIAHPMELVKLVCPECFGYNQVMAGPETSPPVDFDSPLKQCPHCQKDSLQDYDLDYRGVKIARCSTCSCKQMNPPYSDDYLQKLYAGYIHEEEMDGSEPELDKAHKRLHLDHYESLLKFQKPGKVLCIGCGNGFELEAGMEKGYEVEGFDVDQNTVETLKSKYQCPLYHGDFLELELTENNYDLVYMDQVLEHLKDPRPYLEKIHRILKPGGLLFIGVPNIHSFSSRFKTMQGKLGLRRKKRGRHYDTWHHVFYYCPQTLRTVLQGYYPFDVLETGNDSFLLPSLPGWKKTLLRFALSLPIHWRTTCYCVAKAR